MFYFFKTFSALARSLQSLAEVGREMDRQACRDHLNRRGCGQIDNLQDTVFRSLLNVSPTFALFVWFLLSPWSETRLYVFFPAKSTIFHHKFSLARLHTQSLDILLGLHGLDEWNSTSDLEGQIKPRTVRI